MSEQIIPLELNNLSLETDVGGAHKYLRAKLANLGKSFCFRRQKSSGSSFEDLSSKHGLNEYDFDS